MNKHITNTSDNRSDDYTSDALQHTAAESDNPNRMLFEQVGAVLPAADRQDFVQAMCRPGAVAIRRNSAKPATQPLFASDICGSAVAWCPTGQYLTRRPQFTLHPLLHAGCFYVQDPSSMIHREIVGQLVDRISSSSPLRLLDLCAAPGGKTTAMIDALQSAGASDAVVVANELMPKRCAILRENLEKWGYPAVIITNSKAEDFADAGALFDIVAVDAPCSGEGMMRKDETARTQWNAGLVESCASLQQEILCSAVEAVKPGGYLIYSTCTFNTLENESNALYLRDELGLRPVALSLPGTEACGGWMLPDSDEDTPKVWRFMPHLTEGEGLFAVVFQRPDDAPVVAPKAVGARAAKSKKKDDKKNNSRREQGGKSSAKTLSPQEMQRTAEAWIKPDMAGRFEVRQDSDGDSIRYLTAATDALLPWLEERVRIITAGVTVAQSKGRDLIPAQTLAWTTAMRDDAFARCELPLDDALNYLRRDAITLPADTPRGIVLLTYQNVPLGFAKNLGNRANNLYPQNRKILFQ